MKALLTVLCFNLAVVRTGATTDCSIAVKQFNDGTHWIVLEPVVVTDFASVPYGFTALFLPTGQYSRAAVIHDYLYWTQRCTREQADRIFLLAMIESDVPYKTRSTIYRTVRAAGESSWIANQKERQQLYNLGGRAEPLLPQAPAYCAADERDLP